MCCLYATKSKFFIIVLPLLVPVWGHFWGSHMGCIWCKILSHKSHKQLIVSRWCLSKRLKQFLKKYECKSWIEQKTCIWSLLCCVKVQHERFLLLQCPNVFSVCQLNWLQFLFPHVAVHQLRRFTLWTRRRPTTIMNRVLLLRLPSVYVLFSACFSHFWIELVAAVG